MFAVNYRLANEPMGNLRHAFLGSGTKRQNQKCFLYVSEFRGYHLALKRQDVIFWIMCDKIYQVLRRTQNLEGYETISHGVGG